MSSTENKPSTALMIIDMQNGYFRDPSLARQKPSLVSAINRYVKQFRADGSPVINVRTAHAPDGSTWTRNMIEDDQGFMLPGNDRTSVEGLDVDDAIDIIKTRDDAFHDTNLHETLQSLGISRLTIAGISTHSCVFHTAARGYAYDYSVRLLQDAIGDEDDDLARQSIDYLKKEYRINIV